MAKFNDYQEFAFHSVEEYLQMARLCMSIPKKTDATNSNCYGMAALVLIASAMDTIGTFYRDGIQFKTITEADVTDKAKGNKSPLGTVQGHFEEFYNKFLKLESGITNDDFKDKFYEYARCRANHNSVLGPDVEITMKSTGKNDIFTYDGATLIIHLNDLLDSVQKAFEQTKKDAGCSASTLAEGPDTGYTGNLILVQSTCPFANSQ